jgi:HSP20 family protein
MKYEIWDPFEEMRALRRQMDKIFEDFWVKERGLMRGIDIKEPSVDIEDKKREIVVTVDLPGVDKKDIEVHVEQDRIEIKAMKKMEKEMKKKNYYRRERAFSGFYKACSLPALVDPNKAKSSFKNGVLTINLPKIEGLPKKSKRLAIK